MACKRCSNKWTIVGVASVIVVCVIGLVLGFTLLEVTQPGRGLPTMPLGWLPLSLTPCPHQGRSSLPSPTLLVLPSSTALMAFSPIPHPHQDSPPSQLHLPLLLPTTPKLLPRRRSHWPSFLSSFTGFRCLKTTTNLGLQQPRLPPVLPDRHLFLEVMWASQTQHTEPNSFLRPHTCLSLCPLHSHRDQGATLPHPSASGLSPQALHLEAPAFCPPQAPPGPLQQPSPSLIVSLLPVRP